MLSAALFAGGRWMLLLAAFGAIAQPALIISGDSAVWLLDHEHITVNGIVPPHTHPWDRGGGGTTVGCSMSTPLDIQGAASAQTVVCVPSRSGTTTPTAAFARNDAPLERLARGTDFSVSFSAPQAWPSAAIRVPTPPPRS